MALKPLRTYSKFVRVSLSMSYCNFIFTKKRSMSESTSVADVNTTDKDLYQNVDGSIGSNEDLPMPTTDFEKGQLSSSN
ncbi:unnamed protein product [Rotaria socialis]|uniref:Uncharacterized protein n=1 Tax=Rotaria socialis TaxID=392032 RepID=A0A821EK26_9BILA|nr:unnamed protein product [Rotaria socialis]CAF4342171.1 unnamed protein product [Rotaria socialis]CAF4379624.1 unnamed protein product [Rotaria socialis]CAF4636325.1 unnamed protein product [Rotaria socialis]CAF4659114.1 unnamed protein product [Rotaria socialis]